MPARSNQNIFSIAQDPPWVQRPVRSSLLPSESVSSDDLDEPLSPLDHTDMPHISPLRVNKTTPDRTTAPHHAHPDHRIQDHEPKTRQSRLPIFKQMRGILHNKTSLLIPSDLKHNEMTAGTDVKPSYDKGVYEGAFQAQRQKSPTRLRQRRPKSSRSVSPISVLRDENVYNEKLPRFDWDDEPVSPVSPVSDIKPDYNRIPIGLSQVSANARVLPETPKAAPKMQCIKRKPTPSEHSLSVASGNMPSSTPHYSNIEAREASRQSTQPGSHFSWTTVAPETRPCSRPAMEPTTATPPQSRDHGERLPASRFSWSTVQTGMTNMRPDSPPPSPPPVPRQHKEPPYQSILSRHRPIQRVDKEVWTPSRRNASLAYHNCNSGIQTSAKSNITINTRPFTEHDNGGSGKKLPPPPEIISSVSLLTHKEVLMQEEQDKIHQRKNIERAIVDLLKIKNASPLEVAFSQVRDAEKRLMELNSTLAEVQLEEREIGIAIARARRKEGEEEGLWVRRVTS